MDLTWTNIDEFPRLKRVEERALPFLLASNPINWGRPMELNSAEAVMAALYILGEKEQAEGFLPRFNWAPEFLRLNGSMLEDYSKSADGVEVVRIQNEYLESMGDRDSQRFPVGGMKLSASVSILKRMTSDFSVRGLCA
jgi:pre-rRNA-processing protein TSR3